MSDRPPLLTPGERRADTVLTEVGRHHGYRILAHVKLSDIVNRRPAGITQQQWSYATRAHFDFVVADEETTAPEFAVELDDSSHHSEEAQLRDRMKDAICAADGFELLRIEPPALAPGPRGRRIVEYLIDARVMCQAFDKAQAEGTVPLDEPFDYRNSINLRRGGGIDFINDLAMPARAQAMAAHRAGIVAGHYIYNACFHWRSGVVEAWAWLPVKGDLFLFQRTTIRSYRFNCGLGPGELAQDLSTAAISDHLAAMQRGDPVLVRARQLQNRLDRIRQQTSALKDRIGLNDISFEQE